MNRRLLYVIEIPPAAAAAAKVQQLSIKRRRRRKRVGEQISIECINVCFKLAKKKMEEREREKEIDADCPKHARLF